MVGDEKRGRNDQDGSDDEWIADPEDMRGSCASCAN